MDKIASPLELQAELQKIRVYCGNEKPSRQVIADQLQHLAARVAASPDAYLLNDVEDLVSKMDIAIRSMQSIMRDGKKMPELGVPIKHAMSSLVDADRSIRIIRDTLKKS